MTSLLRGRPHRLAPWRSRRLAVQQLEDRSVPAVDVAWAFGLGGATGGGGSADLANDAAGNVFVTGDFRYDVDFDANPSAEYRLTSPRTDAFVAKYAPDGSLLYAAQFGGPDNDDYGRGIDTDAAGNIYVTGNFSGTATFGDVTLTAQSGYDQFVLRLSPAADNPNAYSVSWVRQWQGSGFSFGGELDLAADDVGHLFVTGQTTTHFTEKLDAANGVTLATSPYTPLSSHGIAVSGDGSRVYITGHYAGTKDFDPAAVHADNSDILTSYGRRNDYTDDVFILELSGSLDYVWAGGVGGPSFESAVDIVADASGIYVSGNCGASPLYQASDYDFDPGPGRYSLPLHDENGNFVGGGIFVLKLSTDHTLDWVTGIRSPGSLSRVGRGRMALDGAGSVYVTDVFEGAADFDIEKTYADGRDLHSTQGGRDQFVAKYGTHGDLKWVVTLAETRDDPLAGGVVVNADGSVYFSGMFWGTAVFNHDSDPAVTLDSSNYRDGFVARLTQTPDATPTIGISSVTKVEGDSGTTTYTFTVTLSQASAGTVTVNYATANGTAQAGSDYVATNGTLTFLPGVTSMTITVTVLGDTGVEADEYFFVDLSNALGADLVDAQGIGVIKNDDKRGGKK